jgi:hypothetical protein
MYVILDIGEFEADFSGSECISRYPSFNYIYLAIDMKQIYIFSTKYTSILKL